MNDLAVIILNYNTKEITLECLNSILGKKWNSNIRVVVVDNASTDGSVAAIKNKYPNIEVISNSKNVGFTKGNNIGIKKVYKSSRYCLVLNSDTLVMDKSLDNLVKFADMREFDIFSCKLLNTDKSFQPNAGELPTVIPLFNWLSNLDGLFKFLPSYHETNLSYYCNDRKVGWVSGTAMIIKSSALDKLGFFDEKIFMYAEDVDLCWRANKMRLKVGWTNKSQIMHIGGASLPVESKYKQWISEFKGLIYLYKKHYGMLMSWVLKLSIYFFAILRVIAFRVIGNKEYSNTYAKIIKNI